MNFLFRLPVTLSFASFALGGCVFSALEDSGSGDTEGAVGESEGSSAADDDRCEGRVGEVDEPVESVPVDDVVVSGSARRLEDGGLRIVVNPIVIDDDIAEIARDSVTLGFAGEEFTANSVQRVSEDHPVEMDVVFVMDSTGSMAWAIDGVKEGIEGFTETMEDGGLDVRFAAVDFGDAVRQTLQPTDADGVKDWLRGVSATGGGDAAENPLDAMLTGWDELEFREHAQRFMIVVSDVGMHERDDVDECVEANLIDVVQAMRGDVLLGVLYANAGAGGAGLGLSWLTRSLGGLFVEINIFEALISFDISTDTPFDELATETYVIEVDADTIGELEDDHVDVALEAGGETLQFSLEI